MTQPAQAAGPVLDCAGRSLDLSRPLVMGVINTTPDSFSDGGTLYAAGSLDLDRALKRATAMVQEGAALLDIGGESTRPGAQPISEAQEMDRVLPLVERIADELDVVISVDTSTPALMTEAERLGAGLLNDVRALSKEGAMAAAAATGLPVCLMHMQGQPATMQSEPSYTNVVAEVSDYLLERLAACVENGITSQRILLDPGFGFGKTVTHNMQLLAGLGGLSKLGQPLLVGLSRKSMIGRLLGREVDERLPAGLALAVMAVERGATIVRTHDVRQTVDALAMWVALQDIKTDD